MILCVTINPAVDTTFFIGGFDPVYRTETKKVIHLGGGKGNNAARTLKSMSAPVCTFNPLGGPYGRMLHDLLTAEGIKNIPIQISGETRVVMTLVNDRMEQQAYFAPPADWTNDDLAAVQAGFMRSLDGCDTICFCGSSPNRQSDGLYSEWITAARERKMLTLLDTYGLPLKQGVSSKPDILKINLKEAEGLLGSKLETLDAQIDAMRQIQQSGIDWVVFTLGESGALFACDGQVWEARPPAVKVINPIGAGDALGAGLLWGRIQRLAPLECLLLGMAAAVVDVTTWEAGRVFQDEVKQMTRQIEVIHL